MNYDDGPQDLMTKCCDERGSGCRRVSRCIYTEHSDIRCVSSPERFLKWIIVLCVEAGSHYELTGSEQNRRGSVQSVLTLLKWLQKHVQYFQTQETLPPCVSYTSPSLWDLNRPYSYARARLFGSDSSSKATKDIYFSGVPKYKYKAFNSSAASPDRRCTSHNPTSNQPNYHFLFLSGFIKPQLAHRSEPHHSCCVSWKAETASNCCIQQQQSREEGIQRDFSGKHSTETLN